MLDVLFHSSKTMRPSDAPTDGTRPLFIEQANELATYLASLSSVELEKIMHVSAAKAADTAALYAHWSADHGTTAIDTFIGDMYSGLQASTFTTADRAYAQKHLFILSGLYGILRPLDCIHPYRLEMGYKLPRKPYTNLYSFWHDMLAEQLPSTSILVNASSVEYTKALLPYVTNRVITPKFMTISPKTGEPSNVVVHAKIARGAYARWILTRQLQDPTDLFHFNELNYIYQPSLSTPDQPVYVCEKFGGIGMSVRKS